MLQRWNLNHGAFPRYGAPAEQTGSIGLKNRQLFAAPFIKLIEKALSFRFHHANGFIHKPVSIITCFVKSMGHDKTRQNEEKIDQMKGMAHHRATAKAPGERYVEERDDQRAQPAQTVERVISASGLGFWGCVINVRQ